MFKLSPGSFPSSGQRILVTLLILPSLLLSFNRLGYTSIPLPRIPPFFGWKEVIAALFAWVLILILGSLAARQGNLAWLLLPPLQIVAIGLPIAVLIRIAHRKLENGPRRSWGMVSFSEIITTPLVIVAELVVMGFLLVLFIIYLFGNPGLVAELQQLAQRITTLEQPDPEQILPLIRPLPAKSAGNIRDLRRSQRIGAALRRTAETPGGVGCGTPGLTPAQGFISGAICGGIFALLESLLSVAQPGDGWLPLAVGRAGTGLLHITTTSLVGMSIALAWQTGKYWRLVLNLFIAMAIHGLWNALSVLSGLTAVRQLETGGAGILNGLAAAAPAGGLVLLSLGILALLLNLNRRVRKTLPVPEPVIIDPSQTI